MVETRAVFNVSCPSFESDFEPAVSISRECVGSLHFRGFWPIYLIILPVHFLFLRCSGNNKSGIFLSKHGSGHCPAAGQFYFSKVIDTRSPKQRYSKYWNGSGIRPCQKIEGNKITKNPFVNFFVPKNNSTDYPQIF